MRTRRILAIAFAGVLAAAAALVATEGEADWTLELKVKLELLTELGPDGLGIEVEAADSVVTLAGEVEKRETRELASTVAGSVEGVKRVENRLVLEQAKGSAGQSKVAAELEEAGREVEDGVLETELRLALIDRLGSDGFRVGTEAANGVVTLEIPTDFEGSRRRDAVQVAKGLDGVTKVITVDKR